jgi:hypothetical protein
MGVPLLRKGTRIDDETTSSLVRSGVYHLSDTYDDEEAKKFDGPVTYSFWSAMKYTFTLSLLLWWLPIFGQMIAGYVGGRRAGAPWKGVIAALFPVVFIFIISTLVKWSVLPTVIYGIDLSPEAIAALIATNVPVMQPYIEFVDMYLTSFFTSLHAASNVGLESYVTTVAFAYIGGVLSQQNRRELELLARMSRGTSTTIIVEGNRNNAPEARTVERRGRQPLGFEDLRMIGAEPMTDVEPMPFRTARREIVEEEDPIAMRERRAMRERAQSMSQQQKGVERRVQRRAAEEARPVRRSSEEKTDWEFI